MDARKRLQLLMDQVKHNVDMTTRIRGRRPDYAIVGKDAEAIFDALDNWPKFEGLDIKGRTYAVWFWGRIYNLNIYSRVCGLEPVEKP